MHIEKNQSLREYNSFGFDVNAEYFCIATSVEHVQEAIAWCKERKHPLFVLGGGSNTVFTRNVQGLVLHIKLDNFIVDKHDTSATLQIGAGVLWHKLVKDTVFNGLYGLENLALIPGFAGAAPIQNIGAYGREICDNFISADVIDKSTGEALTISNEECQFAYRHSLFKTPAGENYIVVGIALHLSLQDNAESGYQGLKEALADRPVTAENVFTTVCELRSSKLPDPTVLGNAGSFFKNPVIECQHVDTLKIQYPELPVYPYSDTHRKIPAAWLIDHAGWKGHKNGAVGVHEKQALVLVNHGGGTGQQIAMLATEIQKDILSRFDIQLEREPVHY